MSDIVKLTDLERKSSAWVKIRDYYQRRLDVMRGRNDGDLVIEETAKLRGRIAEIKNLLALDRAPEFEVDD